MSSLQLALEGAWKVLAAGLILGAGLPALFAAGIRSLASGGQDQDQRRLRGTAVAYLCFGIVVVGVLLGLTYIVATGFGKTLTFDHAVPTLVDK
ncbi:hypothetical protein [Actinoplanes utahensis]|uniref:Uncharacterized protein n=1 Tax=Actinoplanes utahensis TaxID=1869 RepID=A0A0A6UIU6_ACTUT|nr:hypothetical protein [Actinoplanes utahensis]KHD74239.1 hypothetical protein MB27_29865 [Actinoplanes utahensis]GIF35463.1 hypothetical protein Aut01nite_84490 [Actinoplanes utahensis]